MRKESSTVQKCKRQMATLGFDSQLAYHRVKLILKIYRDVVWVLSERVEELHEYAWELGAQDADTGLIYLQSFAPDMDLQEFEERVCCVMENRMLVDVIDRALLRLKRYPDRGELYRQGDEPARGGSRPKPREVVSQYGGLHPDQYLLHRRYDLAKKLRHRYDSIPAGSKPWPEAPLLCGAQPPGHRKLCGFSEGTGTDVLPQGAVPWDAPYK